MQAHCVPTTSFTQQLSSYAQSFLVQTIEPAQSPLDPLGFLRHCAQVGNVFSRSDTHRLAALVEACKALLKERFFHLKRRLSGQQTLEFNVQQIFASIATTW